MLKRKVVAPTAHRSTTRPHGECVFDGVKWNLTLVDEYSARMHWNYVRSVALLTKVRFRWQVAQSARSMVGRYCNPQVYMDILEDVQSYDDRCRNTRLSPSEIEKEAQVLFTQYATAMNTVEEWSGEHDQRIAGHINFLDYRFVRQVDGR